MGIVGNAGQTLGNIGGGAAKSVVSFANMLPYIIGGVALAIVLYFIYEDLVLYKYKIHLKKIVGNSFVTIHDKARERRMSNGAKAWYLRKLKVYKAEPPEEVLVHDSKGKIEAYGYLLKDNNIIWAKDTFDLGKIEEKIIDLFKKKPEELSKDDKQLLQFNQENQPISTNDRIVYSEAMKEADFGKKDLHAYLEKILMWTPTIVVIVLLLFGFKYYAEPISEGATSVVGAANALAETTQKVAETNKETALILDQIKGDYQSLKADVDSLKDDIKAKPNKTGVTG